MSNKNIKYPFLIIFFFIGCKGQSNKSAINLKTDDFEISIKNINSVLNEANPSEDYTIKKNDSSIILEPRYLESDNLDDKTVDILKGSYDKVKILYTYDGIFYGDEKIKTSFGIKQDTIIILPIKNNVFKIPKFTIKSINNNDIIEKAYTLNKKYYNSIILNPDKYGGKNSDEYKQALNFLNDDKANYTNLGQLLTEIDYTKLSIELINTKNKNTAKIVFQKLINDEISPNSSNIKKEIKKNYKVVDSLHYDFDLDKDLDVLYFAMSKTEMIEAQVLVFKNETNKMYSKWADVSIPIFSEKEYEKITAKNNFLTFEYKRTADQRYDSYHYLTFKFFNGKIILHKYGIEVYDAKLDKDIPTKIWTSKDFGDIRLEDVTYDFLDKLSNTNPKS